MIKIFLKDSRTMNEVEDESIQFAIYLAGDCDIFFDGKRVIGLSSELVEILQKQPEFTLFSYSFPIWDASTEIMHEILRVLKPNGFLVINVGSILKGEYSLSHIAAHFRSLRVLYPYTIANMIVDHTSLHLLLDFQATYPEQQNLTENISLVNYTEHFFIFSPTPNHKLLLQNSMHYNSPRPLFKGTKFAYCFHEGVIEYLLSCLTRPNDWILDPCAGSGLIGRIAEKLNRNTVLYEIDETLLPYMKDYLRDCEVEWHCQKE